MAYNTKAHLRRNRCHKWFTWVKRIQFVVKNIPTEKILGQMASVVYSLQTLPNNRKGGNNSSYILRGQHYPDTKIGDTKSIKFMKARAFNKILAN